MNDFTPFLKELAITFPDKTTFKNAELNAVADKLGYSLSSIYGKLLDKTQDKVSRGVWNLEGKISNATTPLESIMNKKSITSISDETCYVPSVDPTYISWGHFSDIKTIINSRAFFPVFITGLSGNGKTMMVEQACAKSKREYIRVQITPETDEDDLIGGFRLIDGETVFSKGPAVRAMEKGAILLIDEMDRGTNRIMALQGILEGKPIQIKKTGELIKPAEGFNVIATGNTKGEGSEDGSFSAAFIIDEAFLERFSCTFEQPYPTQAVETRIVMKHMEKFGEVSEEFATNLTTWSDVIRKTYEDGGIDKVISTRRLCQIAQSYSIFKDTLKSVTLGTSRFDSDTKEAFIDLYTKIDSAAERPVEEDQNSTAGGPTNPLDDLFDSLDLFDS